MKAAHRAHESHERTVRMGGGDYVVTDLGHTAASTLQSLPVVLRLLLENVARNSRGTEREQSMASIIRWLDTGTSKDEIPFLPNRVLMHDTTSTPALVDIAAMRDYLAREGGDPSTLNPVLPVDVSVDHSLAIEAFGTPDAAAVNMQHEMRRNHERYRFLRWSSQALDNVHINPPGTGIMHTINLEQLATVVAAEHGAPTRLHPDMLLGTDSHTPMINGIGVLGWGVGGLEAQTVMFGMPTMIRIPDVIGVRLTGTKRASTQATDIALVVTERLRALGVSGEFVEFHGPGVASLKAGERAVIANMAPEYGATTGYFPVDDETLLYLRATGRDESHIGMVRAYCQHMGFWFDPGANPVYTKSIEIDLSRITLSIAGPRRPQDRHNYTESGSVLDALKASFSAEMPAALPRFPVALAAITSCTNTSDPRLLIAAGLLCRKARALGFKVPPWVKTSLSPGSPAAGRYLARAGLLPDLHAMGFDIAGFGCATCIGNAGELTPLVRESLARAQTRPVAMLSGNRNFPGRIHPELDLAFIMSPPLVVAFALAGDAHKNLDEEPLQTDTTGKPVYLRDIWPAEEEIDACLVSSQDAGDYRTAFAQASSNPLWDALDAPDGDLFPWNESSNYLQPPPFAAMRGQSLLGRYMAYPLLVLGDDVTTDHISPASAVPRDSHIADYLVQRGESRSDLNVFAARRGNWKVMVRGAFFSRSLRNLLCNTCPVGHTLHIPSGDMLPLHEVAARYADEGHATVIIAGERYGMGSSRDWAAKVVRLLGARAVLAQSFERIHRSNLIGMGVVPLRLPYSLSCGPLQVRDSDRIELDIDPEQLQPRCLIKARIHRAEGHIDTVDTVAAIETQLEVQFLQAGGVMPTILQRAMRH